MPSRRYADEELIGLLNEAEALVDDPEPLPIDDEVQAVRNPKRPPCGWSAPQLTIPPIRFARISLVEAVAAGGLDEVFSDPDQRREARNKLNAIARQAKKARDSLDQLLSSLRTEKRLVSIISNDVSGAQANDLLEDMRHAMEVVTSIANKSKRAAQLRVRPITPAEAAFRRGFTVYMAEVYYLLTGLPPTGTRKESGTPFTRFVDAAMQSILPEDEPSCAGVLRTALPRFRRECTDEYLEERKRELWVDARAGR